MSRFIQHLPCPNCGSKDNLAEYEDHFYCFGCRKNTPKNDLDSIRRRLQKEDKPDVTSLLQLVTISDIPKEPSRWLLQYGITSADAIRYGISWNESDRLLVLVQSPTYWQARCFGNQTTKYMSKGKKPLLFYGEGDTIICVEDILSAIKLAKAGYCATPVLGSFVTPELEETLMERFKTVIIWLDRDKAKEAVLTAKKFISKGKNSMAIITPRDPKEYTKGELDEWLKNK